MISALTLRAAWQWCRKHALAIVAALAAIGGLVAYALGRRSTKADASRATDVGRVEGRVEVLDATAAEHAAQANAARDEQAALVRAQDAAEAAAREKAAEVERMSPDEKVALGAALFAERRRQRQEGRQ